MTLRSQDLGFRIIRTNPVAWSSPVGPKQQAMLGSNLGLPLRLELFQAPPGRSWDEGRGVIRPLHAALAGSRLSSCSELQTWTNLGRS